MSSKSGRVMYIPLVVIDELEDLMREDEITTQVEGFHKLIKYTRVGREVNRMRTLDFSKKRVLPSVDSYPSPKKRKRKSDPFDFNLRLFE